MTPCPGHSLSVYALYQATSSTHNASFLKGLLFLMFPDLAVSECPPLVYQLSCSRSTPSPAPPPRGKGSPGAPPDRRGTRGPRLCPSRRAPPRTTSPPAPCSRSRPSPPPPPPWCAQRAGWCPPCITRPGRTSPWCPGGRGTSPTRACTPVCPSTWPWSRVGGEAAAGPRNFCSPRD
jgi:hypothetical protein